MTTSTEGMSRRRFLASTAAAGAAAAAAGPLAAAELVGATTPPALPPLPTRSLAAHVASRLTFGPLPGQIAAIERLGVDAWIERQLAPTGLYDAGDRVAAYTTLTATPKATGAALAADWWRATFELRHSTVIRQRYSERQLYEVMVEFWTNHFNIWPEADEWLAGLKNWDDTYVIRRHALGRFADLLKASARSPAMLVYLDNAWSNANGSTGLIENYARELLELHTMGIVNGRRLYTEADVRSVAKLMSGRRIEWNGAASNHLSFRFDPWLHSSSALSILGWSRPARADRTLGLADGDRFLDHVARHPSTVHFLAVKLCRRFVSDTPPTTLVEAVKKAYLANDTQIVPVLRTIFRSAEFRASSGRKLRRPHELVLAMLRGMNAGISAPSMASPTSGPDRRQVAWWFDTRLHELGQRLHGCPTPNGYPDRAVNWLSTNGQLRRWSVGAELAHNRTPQEVGDRIISSPAALLPATTPATVSGLFDAVTLQLLGVRLPAAHKTALARAIDPAITPASAASTVTGTPGHLPELVALVLAHPYFQYR